MRRLSVVKLVMACLATLLVVQLLLPLVGFMNEDVNSAQHESSRDSEQELLRRLVEVATAVLVPVILVEPVLLQALVSGPPVLPPCFPWCQAPDILTLATLAEDWAPQEKGILQRLRALGASLRVVQSEDPNLAGRGPSAQSAPSKLTTHLFLWHDGTSGPTLHLVVLHGRGSNSYFWLGPVPPSDLQGLDQLTPQSLTLGQTAAAFPRFSLKPLSAGRLRLFVPADLDSFLYHQSQSTFLECNYTRADKFRTLYPSAESSEADQFTRKARQLLARTRDILETLRVPFWLSSGTCLGWYRQCGIIPYSRDIDIGIRIADYNDNTINAFERNGFLLKHIFGKVSDSLELSFQAGDIKLDIFFFYQHQNFTWNGGTQASTGRKFLYKFPHFSTCRAELLGLLMWVPCPTLPYVLANYGQDWFTPVRHWDWKASPPNVQENGVWPHEEWEEVIQVYEV